MNRFVSLLLLAAVFAAAGCSAISGHRVVNAENGEDVHGLPIVIQRPRYLKITYKEVEYGLLLTNTESAGGKPTGAPGTGDNTTPAPTQTKISQQVQAGHTSIEVQIDTIDVGEVYAIDVKRPMAGSADIGIEFEPGKQYPKNVRSKVDDTTLKTMSDAIGNILSKVVKGAGTEGMVPQAANQVVLSTRITRIEIYDLENLHKPVCILNPQGREGPNEPTPSETPHQVKP